MKFWIEERDYGFICVQEDSEEEQVQEESSLIKPQPALTLQEQEEQARIEEAKEIEELAGEDGEDEEKPAEKKISEPEFKPGDLVVIPKGYALVRKVGPEISTLVFGKEILETKNSEIETKSKVLVVLHSEEKVEELEASFDPNTTITEVMRQLKEEMPKHHNFIFTKVFVKNKLVELVDKFEKSDAEQTAEINKEDSNEEKKEEEASKEKKDEKNENVEKKEEEPKKDEQKDPIEEKKEEEAPLIEFDDKIYEKESEELQILKNCKLGNTSIKSGSEIEIFVMKVTCFKYAQLFDEVIYIPKKLENWTFVSAEDIILYGFGLYGPFPHYMGKSCIEAKLEISNESTGQKIMMEIKNEDEKEGVKQFYLPEPIYVGRSDVIIFNVLESLQHVYALTGRSNIIFGTDGIQFRIAAHREGVFAALYYESAEEFEEKEEERVEESKK